MLDFKTKRKIKEILYSKVSIGILFLFLLFFANSTWSVYQKSSYAKGNMDIAENNLNKLKERKKILVNKIEILKTNRGVEEDIRSKFGLVKKGEEVVVIINSKKSGDENIVRQGGFIAKWRERFFGLFK